MLAAVPTHEGPSRGAARIGLFASVLLAVCAVLYGGLLLVLLGVALYTAPSAWQSTPTAAFLAVTVGVICASAGLLLLTTVPFRAIAHFRAVQKAIDYCHPVPEAGGIIVYGLGAAAVLFGLASLMPILDGEYGRGPWFHVAFQMTILGAPSVFALVALRAEVMLRNETPFDTDAGN